MQGSLSSKLGGSDTMVRPPVFVDGVGVDAARALEVVGDRLIGMISVQSFLPADGQAASSIYLIQLWSLMERCKHGIEWVPASHAIPYQGLSEVLPAANHPLSKPLVQEVCWNPSTCPISRVNRPAAIWKKWNGAHSPVPCRVRAGKLSWTTLAIVHALAKLSIATTDNSRQGSDKSVLFAS